MSRCSTSATLAVGLATHAPALILRPPQHYQGIVEATLRMTAKDRLYFYTHAKCLYENLPLDYELSPSPESSTQILEI